MTKKDFEREVIAVIILTVVLLGLTYCLFEGIIEYTKNW